MTVVEGHAYVRTKLLLDGAMHVGPVVAVGKQQPFPPKMLARDHWQFGDGMLLRGRDQQLLPPERQHIESWRVNRGAQERDVDATAPVVWNWWETYIQRKPRWPVALAALDKLLREES